MSTSTTHLVSAQGFNSLRVPRRARRNHQSLLSNKHLRELQHQQPRASTSTGDQYSLAKRSTHHRRSTPVVILDLNPASQLRKPNNSTATTRQCRRLGECRPRRLPCNTFSGRNHVLSQWAIVHWELLRIDHAKYGISCLQDIAVSILSRGVVADCRDRAGEIMAWDPGIAVEVGNGAHELALGREERDVGDFDQDLMGLEICGLGLWEVMLELEDLLGWAPACVCPCFHLG